MLSVRKKDQVHDELLRRLLTAQYRFGERISVKEISEETGISRQPIMTALNALSSEGFVNIVAQVGCEVSAPTPSDIGDFYLMFERLEGLMAELAALRATPQQIRRLASVNSQVPMIDTNSDDAPEQYRLINREFHGIIHEMARSPLLHERQKNNLDMSDFFIAQTVGFIPHMLDAAAEHDDIIAAISAGDATRARCTTERHIQSVGDEVLSGTNTAQFSLAPVAQA